MITACLMIFLTEKLVFRERQAFSPDLLGVAVMMRNGSLGSVHLAPLPVFFGSRSFALIRVAAVTLLFGWLGSPLLAQSPGLLSEAGLLAALRSFKTEIDEMQKQLAASPLIQRGNRRALRYEEYSALYTGWSGRVQERYALLNNYYEQLNRVYRANPNSKLYLDARKAYVDAKAAFDALSAALAECAKPDDLRAPTIVIMDGRLNTHLTKTVSTVQTETKPSVDISQADELRYIGKFDAVELYLLVHGSTACYVMYGLHERKVDAAGQAIDEVDSRVVFSRTFNVGAVQGFAPQDHLDHVLKLDLTPVQAQVETWRFITESLARAKSYARSD
ncbi:MAG: hypothetical protein CFK52_06140 [Chloracidobacterium sp. CP2_5A]|nr:MAG: hypothetical protein CFK52_06140 [Chloracidobacterium sp. CP2_5A]